MKESTFIPKKTYYVLFDQDKFDCVQKKCDPKDIKTKIEGIKILGRAGSEKMKQGLSNLKDVGKDNEVFLRTFERFAEAEIVKLGNRSVKKMNKKRSNLKK